MTTPGTTTDPLHHHKRELYKKAVLYGDICTASNLCDLFMKEILKVGDEEKLPYYLNRAFMSAICTAYSRIFSDSHGVGRLSNKWEQFDNSEDKDTHDRMLKLRNETYAHTDCKEPLRIFPKGTPLPDGRPSPNVAWAFTREEFKPDAILGIKRCIEHVKSKLEKDLSGKLDSIYATRQLSEGVDEIHWK